MCYPFMIGMGFKPNWLSVPSDIIPDADLTRNLGSTAKNWAVVYVRRIYSPSTYMELILTGNAVHCYTLSQRENIADANHTLLDISHMLRGAYWDGAVSKTRDITIKHNLTDTTPTSELDFQIPHGTDIFKMYENGNAWMLGKLTQLGCPSFEEQGITPMEYIEESMEKEYHETQSEVWALCHLIKSQQDKIDKLESRLSKLEKRIA